MTSWPKQTRSVTFLFSSHNLLIFLKTFQDGNGKLDYDEFVKILVGPK